MKDFEKDDVVIDKMRNLGRIVRRDGTYYQVRYSTGHEFMMPAEMLNLVFSKKMLGDSYNHSQDSKFSNYVCPHCGGPAYAGMNRITCSVCG